MIIEYILTFLMLVALQIVLGFDNLLYISIESKRAPDEKQSMVRKWGISIAILLRIGLLFLLVNLVSSFQDPILVISSGFITSTFNIHSIIVLFGGIFIIYTAMKEIWHMLRLEHGVEDKGNQSTLRVISMIIVMNVVFSFDSILSAMALTDVFGIMVAAIVVSGGLMIYMADKVSNFLKKNRMFEVLGLFILFIVGIMLVSEGGHLAHMRLFGEEITPMSKTTFYFILFIVVIIEIVQSKYQKKLDKNEK